jgi:protease IV
MSTTPQPEGALPQPQSSSPQAEGASSPRSAAPASNVPIASPYVPPARPARRGFWGRLLIALIVILVGGSLLLNFVADRMGGSLLGDGSPRVQEKFFSHNAYGKNKVVILPIEGIILETDDGFVKRAIDTAMKDPQVKAIVLRVDSPGGSVSGSDYIYHHLCKLVKDKQIPIVVSMGSIAASGGYYVSMAVGHEPDTIYAEPTGFTGSIGVIIPHYNLSGLLKDKVEDDSIASNDLKKMGSITRPMTDAERKIFNDLVEENFEHFKSIVRSGRAKFEKDPGALNKLATGQIFTAEQAAKNGLIDKTGFIEDAVDRAIELAGLEKNQVRVVRYKPEASLASALMGGQSHASANVDLKALLEMTTPRAYYLASWMPALAGAAK